MTPTPELDPDALAAARTWAAEHGHQQPDDRMLAAYGQMIAARAAEQERERGASILRQLLIEHQRDYPGGCCCGWADWGKSWAEHVTQQWQVAHG